MRKRKENYFYHQNYFGKILKLIEESRMTEAILACEKYLKSYPQDLKAYVFYADTLISLNRIEEAESILNFSTSVIKDATPDLSMEDLLRVKIRLLCFQKKYLEAYELICSNTAIFYKRKWGVNRVKIFLEKKLNMIEEFNLKKLNYTIQQILSYDETRAIQHIKDHSSSTENPEPLQFVENFPVESTYFKIRAMLPTDPKLLSDFCMNKYVFKYDANGHINSKLVDYIKVVSITDSNDIITMYPYENKERSAYIDLNPLEEELIKVKKISQIEKFNQRYQK